ncbi:MAG TPA: sugar ABC transporter substrate-binding protein [Anaerolineae bacterium]|nr:sugar ABC transporter substrate-binding protein [Anaerolineae bacterium]
MKDQKLTRRNFLVLSAGAAVGSWLTGCGAATPAPEQPAAEQPAEAAATEAPVAAATEAAVPAPEVVTVSFSGWGATQEDEGVRAAMKVFEEQNPNIKMEWIHIPDTGAYNDRVLSMAAAGTPPDTGFIQSDIFTTFARDGVLLDITDRVKGDPVIGQENYFIEPQETQRCTFDDKWYGIGSCWVAPHIYYNADVFEAEGLEPPSNDPEQVWDWDHMLEVATQLTVDNNGNHPGDSGFDIDNVKRWGIHWPTWWIPLHAAMISNGGDWVDRETGLVVADQPEAVEAIQNVADLMGKHQVMPHASVFQRSETSDVPQMLEGGLLAMAVDGSWALSWLTELQIGLGTAVLPQMKQPATTLQAHLHSVFAGTKQPEEAWQWVAFLATEYYQLQFLKIGLWLPSQTALMTPEGREKWLTSRTAPGEGVHPEGYEQLVTEFIPQYGQVLYMPPGWNKATSVLYPALDSVFVGDQTAEEAMAAAVPEANAILEAEQKKGG